MSKDVSRRKALSLLGLGAALGFTLSSALEPLEAQAQEAAPATPAAPAATGTHGMQRRQGRRTHRHERRHGRHERRHGGERVRNQGDRQQPRRNRRSVCFRAPDRAIGRTQKCISVRRTTPCARPQTKRKGGDGSTPLPQNSTGNHLVMTELLRRGFEAELAGSSPSYSRRSSISCLRGFWDLGAHGFVGLFHCLTTDTFANALEG